MLSNKTYIHDSSFRRKIPEYPGYWVSQNGNIFSQWGKGNPQSKGVLAKQIKLRPGLSTNGYLSVVLWKEGRQKTFYVHRLVLETWKPPFTPKTDVRHINGNKLDNRLYNLEWGSRKDNMQDAIRHGTVRLGDNHPFSKLNKNQVICIKEEIRSGALLKHIANKYNVARTTISDIKHGRTWKNV